MTLPQKTKAMKSITLALLALVMLASCATTRNTTQEPVHVSKVLYRVSNSVVLTKGNYDHFKLRAEMRARKAAALQLATTAARGTGGVVLGK